MNPLKPCPFCLTEGDERLIELWDTFDAGHIAHIHCTHCGADGPSVYGEMDAAPTIARARSMWNKQRSNNKPKHNAHVAALDCRTCRHYTEKAGGCMSVVRCVQGCAYQRAGVRAYWSDK